MISNKVVLVAVLTLLMFITTACYGCTFGVPVGSNERGLHMPDGNNPTLVKEPGRHSDMGYLANLVVVDTGVKTFEWTDNSLVTRDKQPIGLVLSISVSRPIEAQTLLDMYRDYRSATVEDASLQSLVFSRVPRVAKGFTAGQSLDELLGRTEAVQSELFDSLQTELNEFGVRLVDIGIQDLLVTPEYEALLNQKAAVQAQTEQAKTEVIQLEQELLKEETTTRIELEKARRENEVLILEAKALETSPVLLQLELAKIQADVLNNKDKIYFIPNDVALNLFMGNTQAMPLSVTQPISPTN